MNIIQTNLTRLTHWESFQFIDHTIGFAESYEEEMPELYTNKLAELNIAFRIFDDVLVQQQRTSPEGLIKAEEDRDYAIRKIYNIIKEYSDYRFNKEKEDAANVLLKVFKPYGTGSQIAKMKQESETAAITNLIQDFKKLEAAQSIIALGLVDAIESLETNNYLFKETQIDRFTDKSKFVVGLVRSARDEAEKQVMAFADVVNALAIVEGPEKYVGLKSKVNTVLQEYVASSKQSAKKKDEEIPEEVTQEK